MQKFKKLDHFQILQMIGKGANGLVYKGLNTTNGSIVAIKEMVMGKSDVKAIKAQLNLLKQLDHPCIVKYIDAIQKQNRIYLILQYMEGGSLAALVRKSPLDQEVAKIYVKQVLMGLVFLHKNQVIHRDIKGANILLTKNGLVKLADFGVAVKLQQSQKTISAAGSPYWMAPQIISSQAQPTTKCDIWSLGCTVIELLTGNPPYYQLMQFPALFRIVEDAHPPLPPCTNECKQFLLCCFAKQPKTRLSAEELLNSSWLKMAKDQQAYLVKEQYGKVSKQIEAFLHPVIYYHELARIAKQKRDSMIICKHKCFQAVLLDNRSSINIARVQFIISLIKGDHRVIQMLAKSGMIEQELQKFKQKYQFSEESLTAIFCLIQTFIAAYENSVKQIQLNAYVHQNYELSNRYSFLEHFIIRNCLPTICKILVSFTKERKRKIKQSMVICLHQFICAVLALNNKEHQTQILMQVVIRLEEIGGLKEICILNVSQTEMYFVKLDIIHKIAPHLIFLASLKPVYRKIVTLIFVQLLKIQLVEQKQNITALKLMCLSILMVNDKFKYIAEKYGFIHHISEYYAQLSKNNGQTNYALVFQSIICLSNFFNNDKGGIDHNRISQFCKNSGKNNIQIIYSKIQNQLKINKKQIKCGTLFEEIKYILKMLQNCLI